MKSLIIFSTLVLAFLVLVYRGAIFGGKIAFPSNYLVHFFAPWSEEKFPGWEQGVPNKPIGTDQIRFFYPEQTFSNRALTNLRLPLWDPYIFSGNPHIANYQSAVFYPFKLLYFFLPQLTAWTVLTMLVPFLAFVFCYAFLRSLNLDKVSSFVGAFSFGLSGFIITWSQEAFALAQSAIWLPLILWGLSKYFHTFSAKFLFISSFALAMSLLAGYLQITFYICILATGYALYLLNKSDKAQRGVSALLLTIAAALAFSISAVQILPSLEGYLVSPRPTVKINQVFDTYLLSPAHLINAVAPDIDGNPASYNFFGRGSYNETALYIGVTPLIFALLALLKFTKNKSTSFFAASALISFILTSNLPLVKQFLTLPWPLIPTFQPSRILLLTTFSLSVLAAIGLAQWQKFQDENLGQLIRKICALTAVVLALSIVWRLLSFLHNFLLNNSINHSWPVLVSLWKISPEFISLKNILLPLLLLGMTGALTFEKLPKKLAIGGLIAITLFSQFYFFSKYLNLGEKQFLYPQNRLLDFIAQSQKDYSRYVSFQKPIFGNISTQMGLYSPEGFDPIFSKRYGQLVQAGQSDGRLTENIPRIEVNLSNLAQNLHGDVLDLATQPKKLRLLSLLGVTTVLYYPDTKTTTPSDAIFPSEDFQSTGTISGWLTYHYTQALPRVFLTGNFIVESDPQKILDHLFDQKFNLATTLVLEKTPSQSSPPTPGTTLDEAKIVSYEPEKIVITTSSSGPRLLFLSDNYYPGWMAAVDGKPTEVYQTDFTFRSILVGPGKHLVEFSYRPYLVTLGSVISLVSIGIFIILLVGSHLRESRSDKHAS